MPSLPAAHRGFVEVGAIDDPTRVRELTASLEVVHSTEPAKEDRRRGEGTHSRDLEQRVARLFVASGPQEAFAEARDAANDAGQDLRLLRVSDRAEVVAGLVSDRRRLNG